MDLRAHILACTAALAAAGCATVEPAPRPLVTSFDPTELAWAKERGANRIEGDALLRTRGGDVKTCAGLDVRLLPLSNYTSEWVQRTYGRQDSGFRSQVRTLDPPLGMDRRIQDFIAETRCNAQGRFSFDGLADGPYYVIARVTWEAPAVTGGSAYLAGQGGELVQRVDVAGSETKTVVLTR